MQHRFRFAAGFAVLLIGCAPDAPRPTGAERIETNAISDFEIQDSGCSMRGNTAIPDGRLAGVVLGPLETAQDGETLGKIVLALDVIHPEPGDLEIQLGYDVANDGRLDLVVPVGLHLARAGDSQEREDHACFLHMDGVYFFRDDFAGDEDSLFSAFEGLPRGGSFYLIAADTVGGAAGTLRAWGVSVAGAASAPKSP